MANLYSRYGNEAAFVKVKKEFEKPVVGGGANDVRGLLKDIYVLCGKLYRRCEHIVKRAEEIEQKDGSPKPLECNMEHWKNNAADEESCSCGSGVECLKCQEDWKVEVPEDDSQEGEEDEDDEDDGRMFDEVVSGDSDLD